MSGFASRRWPMSVECHMVCAAVSASGEEDRLGVISRRYAKRREREGVWLFGGPKRVASIR